MNIRISLSLALVFLFSCVDAQTFSDSVTIEQILISNDRASDVAPATFQNISNKELDLINLGQDPVALIQQLSPSIVSYSDGGTDIGNYSQLRLRGIDQSRINMTLNGVPLNDMVDHGTYFSNFSDFGNSIESIQIQRGASATQKGLSSYGGAMNFESTNIFKERNANAQVTVGSFGTLRTSGEYTSGLLDDGFGYYGRMTRTETDGYKYNSASDSYSFFFSGGKLTENGMIKLTAFSGKTQNGQSYLHVPLDVIVDDPKTNNNDLNDIDDFEQSMIHLQSGLNLPNNWTLNSNLYYNQAGGVFPFTFAGDQYMYGLENDQYGAFINADKNLGQGNFSVGAHAYIFDRENYEYVAPSVTQPYTRDYTEKTEFNVFARYGYQTSQLNLFANLELRSIDMSMSGDESLGVDLNMSHDWTFINGSVGLNYSLNRASSVYASLTHTNREPTRSDIFNGVTDSESVLDLEFGWKYSNDNFNINVNGFLMSFNNEITNIGALQERSYMEIRQNVDKSNRVGIEAVMNYLLNESISANLNLAWMNSNINEYNNGSVTFTDVNHIFTPTWVIAPSIRTKFTEDIALNISSRYVSESFSELSNDQDFLLPAHFILNLQLDFPIVNRLKASLMFNNISNELYFTEGGPIDVDFDGNVEGMGYRVQPPRHFYLMLKYDF